jgi:hypothetical protein
MDHIASDTGSARARDVSRTGGTFRTDMAASTRALFAADEAHVHEAMNSVRWERRGIFQRLIRSRD